jgi:hypothetical protein
MLKSRAVASNEEPLVLSSLAPSPAQKRLAAASVLGLPAALYLVLGPFGGMQLNTVRSFVAIYTTAMFMTDSITAILLYMQLARCAVRRPLHELLFEQHVNVRCKSHAHSLCQPDERRQASVTVTSCGRICLAGRKINVSHAFAGQAVGIKEVAEKIWLVTFMHYDLASSITKNGARRMRADPFEAGVTCASGMDT